MIILILQSIIIMKATINPSLYIKFLLRQHYYYKQHQHQEIISIHHHPSSSSYHYSNWRAVDFASPNLEYWRNVRLVLLVVLLTPFSRAASFINNVITTTTTHSNIIYWSIIKWYFIIILTINIKHEEKSSRRKTQFCFKSSPHFIYYAPDRGLYALARNLIEWDFYSVYD